MSARLILHIITTLVLFAFGSWLYIRMGDDATDAINETSVATFWFASLVFIFFSWLFYWPMHRLKLKAWIIALIIAVIIAAVSTVVLKKVADENQRKLEEIEMQKESAADVTEDASVQETEEKLETLNLGEGDELPEIEEGQ